MKKLFFSGVFCALFLAIPSAWAQVYDGPPVDMKEMVRLIQMIKEKRKETEKALQNKALQDFQSAAGSPAAAISFYGRVIQTVQPDRIRSDYADWAKSDAAQNAARLHLNYLVLTIQRANGATTQQLEPALMSHIAALKQAGLKDEEILHKRKREQDQKSSGLQPVKGRTPATQIPLFEEQELIKQSVRNSAFVKCYRIGKQFSDVKNWEFSPGNIEGIYQNTLLPYYRENKDQRLIAFWDQKIQQEGQEVAKGTQFQIDQFKTVRHPQLIWLRAQDMNEIGQRNRALTEMFNLVKNYPDHADLMSWIAQLEELLTPSPSPSTVEPEESKGHTD